jgi:hypothetical protein
VQVVEDNNEHRVLNAAKRYAAFDKSDPFALARALCHIRQGLCKYTLEGKEGWYDAEEHSTFGVGGVVSTYYTNMVRP